MKSTLEMGRKLAPLSSSSSPPSTEQEVTLTDSMTGSSWAERWAKAHGRGKENGETNVLRTEHYTGETWNVNFVFFLCTPLACNSQHSMGKEATCRASTRPGEATGGDRGRWVRNTKRTRVFFRPTSVSPFLSSMSEFLSLRIPAQSMLRHTEKPL